MKNAFTPACILFDLDGTLLDTAPDMARALNRLRAEQGLTPLTLDRIRPVVSHGAIAMISIGFGLQPEDPGFAKLRQRFLEIYRADLATETTLFTGMEALLSNLETTGIPWGVVTNKPAWLTEPLMNSLDLFSRAACVVSGDTTPKRKPDPEPLLHACRLLGIEPMRALYIGDAERDIEAGKRAGMRTIVARFGYLDAADKPETWGADALIDKPEDLLNWLNSPATQVRPAAMIDFMR